MAAKKAPGGPLFEQFWVCAGAGAHKARAVLKFAVGLSCSSSSKLGAACVGATPRGMLLESLGREPLHRGLSWVCRAELRHNLGLQSEGASGESPILECIVGKSRAGGAFLRFAVDLLDAASMPGLFALVPVLTIGAQLKQKARTHIQYPQLWLDEGAGGDTGVAHRCRS